MHEAVLLLQKLIQIPSTNDQEAAVATVIKTTLAEHGIKSQLIKYAPNRSNLVAEIGNPNSQTVLGFTGHMDVVLPGDTNTWKFPPFGGEIHDNRIYGRGAADMKSGLVALVYAFINLASKPDKLNGKIRLILTVGEENGAQGAHQLTNQHFADDLSGLIVAEPTDGKVIYAHRGSFNYTITSYGKQVHSSTPELGINAINGLFAFATQEATAFDNTPVDSILGSVSHAITIIHGGEQINNIPAFATLRGNIRPVPTFNNQQVADTLSAIVANVNENSVFDLHLNIDNSFVPIKTHPTAHIVNAATSAVSSITKYPAELGIFPGATDASEFVLTDNTFDTIILGPGPEDISHQVDEYVELDQFEAMIKIYQQLAYNYFD